MGSLCSSLQRRAFFGQAIRSEYHLQWQKLHRDYPSCHDCLQCLFCDCCGCIPPEEERDPLGPGNPFDSDDADNDQSGWELQVQQPRIQSPMKMPQLDPVRERDNYVDPFLDQQNDDALNPESFTDIQLAAEVESFREGMQYNSSQTESQTASKETRNKKKYRKSCYSQTKARLKLGGLIKQKVLEPKLHRIATYNRFLKNHGFALPNLNGRVYNILEEHDPKRQFRHLAVPNGKNGFKRAETAIVIDIASATISTPKNHISESKATGSMAIFVGKGSEHNISEIVHLPLDSSATQDEITSSFELLSCLGVLVEAPEIKKTFEQQSRGNKLACIVVKSSSEKCVSTATEWLANASRDDWLEEDGTLVWQHIAFKLRAHIASLRDLGTLVYFSYVSKESNAPALLQAESELQRYYSEFDL